MENTGSKWFFILVIFFLPLLNFAQDAEKKTETMQSEKTEKSADGKEKEKEEIKSTEKKAPEEKKIEIQEVKQQDIHQKMLIKLNLTSSDEKESFLRRGEIVFFIAFGYTFMYQFIIYDQIFGSAFSENTLKGELIDRNLGFAVITSLMIALLVSRNDIQKQHYIQMGRNFSYSKAQLDQSFDRGKKGYNWYFNVFHWDF